MTLSVVYWLYNDPTGVRRYTAAHINAQLPMLARHLHVPYQVIVITDEPQGLDPSVEVFPAPAIATDLEMEAVTDLGGYPSCLRRLWNWSHGARALGERIMAMDADSVILRDLNPLVERDEDCVLWRSPSNVIQGCGYLLRTGTRHGVWHAFMEQPKPWPTRGRFACSDQGWLNLCPPHDAGSWTEHDGAYIPRKGWTTPPANARLVSFSDCKPWTEIGQTEHPWISEHYNAQL